MSERAEVLTLDAATLYVGDRPYTITGQVGSGRSGVVYRAEPADSHGSPVLAVKVARPGIGDDLIRSLEREAAFLDKFGKKLEQIGKKLEEKGEGGGAGRVRVPAFRGRGILDGKPYFASDLVVSPDAVQLLGESIDETELAELGQQLLTLLSVLHEEKQTYLDFKLENIRWDRNGRRLTVIDWNEIGEVATDRDGIARDLLRAHVYLHGLATGSVVPTFGLAVIGPFDRSARWKELSPFAQHLFETAFRADVHGRVPDAATAADRWSRLWRLWNDLSLRHAQEIEAHYDDLSKAALEKRKWTDFLMEQRAASTLRRAVEAAPGALVPDRDQLIASLHLMVDAFDRQLRRRDDPLGPGRNLLGGNSLEPALRAFGEVAAHDPAGVRWYAATLALQRSTKATRVEPASALSGLLVEALEAAGKSEWETVVAKCASLRTTAPYAETADLLSTEAEIRLAYAAKRRAGEKNPTEARAELEKIKTLVAKVGDPERGDPRLRKLLEDETLGEEALRAEIAHFKQLEREAPPPEQTRILLEHPTPGRLGEAVKAARAALRAAATDEEVVAGLDAWARQALDEDESESAATLAGIAIGLGASLETSRIYRAAVERRGLELRVERGDLPGAVEELDRKSSASPGDRWMREKLREWRSELEKSAGEARKRADALVQSTDLATIDAPEEAERLLLEASTVVRELAALGQRTDGYEERLRGIRRRIDSAREQQRRKSREGAIHALYGEALGALGSGTLPDWERARELLGMIDQEAAHLDDRAFADRLTSSVQEVAEKLVEACDAAAKGERALTAAVKATPPNWEEALKLIGPLQALQVPAPQSLPRSGTWSPAPPPTFPYRLNGLLTPDGLPRLAARAQANLTLEKARQGVRVVQEKELQRVEVVLEAYSDMSNDRPIGGSRLAELRSEYGHLSPAVRDELDPLLAGLLRHAGATWYWVAEPLFVIARKAAGTEHEVARKELERHVGASSPDVLDQVRVAWRLTDACLRARDLLQRIKGERSPEPPPDIIPEAQAVIAELVRADHARQDQNISLRDLQTSLDAILRYLRDRVSGLETLLAQQSSGIRLPVSKTKAPSQQAEVKQVLKQVEVLVTQYEKYIAEIKSPQAASKTAPGPGG